MVVVVDPNHSMYYTLRSNAHERKDWVDQVAGPRVGTSVLKWLLESKWILDVMMVEQLKLLLVCNVSADRRVTLLGLMGENVEVVQQVPSHH